MKKCIACGYNKKKDWKDYECPRCRCPQTFMFPLPKWITLRNRFTYFLWEFIASKWFFLFDWGKLKKSYNKHSKPFSECSFSCILCRDWNKI